MGFMDDAKNAADNVTRKAKEAWEDATDGDDDATDRDGRPGRRTDHSGDARRADATDGTVGKHHEDPEQLRRDL